MGLQKELVITTHMLEKAAELFCYMGWLLLKYLLTIASEKGLPI